MRDSLRMATFIGVTRLAWWEARQARLWFLLWQARRRNWCILEAELRSVLVGYLRDVERWLPYVTRYVALVGDDRERRLLERVKECGCSRMRLVLAGEDMIGQGDLFISGSVVGELLEVRRRVQRLCAALQERWAAV